MRLLPFLLLLLTQNSFAIGAYYYNAIANGTYETAQSACNAYAKTKQGTGVLSGTVCTVNSSSATILFSSNTCAKGVGGNYPAKVLYRSSDVSSNLTLAQAESRTTEILAKTPNNICSSSCTYVSPSVTFLTSDGITVANFNYVYEANGLVCSPDNTSSIPSNVNLSGGTGGNTGGGDGDGGTGGNTGGTGGNTGGTGGNTGGNTGGGTVSLSADDKRILNNIIAKQNEQIRKSEENAYWYSNNIKDNIQALGEYIGDAFSALSVNLGNWFSDLNSTIRNTGGGDTGGGETGGGDTGGGETGGGETGGGDTDGDDLIDEIANIGTETNDSKVIESKLEVDNSFNNLASLLSFTNKQCPSDISVSVPIYNSATQFVIPISKWCSLFAILKLMLYIAVYMYCLRMLYSGVYSL